MRSLQSLSSGSRRLFAAFAVAAAGLAMAAPTSPPKPNAKISSILQRATEIQQQNKTEADASFSAELPKNIKHMDAHYKTYKTETDPIKKFFAMIDVWSYAEGLSETIDPDYKDLDRKAIDSQKSAAAKVAFQHVLADMKAHPKDTLGNHYRLNILELSYAHMGPLAKETGISGTQIATMISTNRNALLKNGIPELNALRSSAKITDFNAYARLWRAVGSSLSGLQVDLEDKAYAEDNRRSADGSKLWDRPIRQAVAEHIAKRYPGLDEALGRDEKAIIKAGCFESENLEGIRLGTFKCKTP